jgi:hypothetical protein
LLWNGIAMQCMAHQERKLLDINLLRTLAYNLYN